ncbi:hypothetical protein MKEN_00302000 [Mycena kentingensis (nom. inval.)]|nr:hypothetical protein MKEN_00302000 [Mycena kentingensis (nom. inval.)]
MSVYDYSPAAIAQHQRTQQRIAGWAQATAEVSSQYQNPFLPRPDSELRANSFYNPSVGKSPRRSYTTPLVSPQDSISQVGFAAPPPPLAHRRSRSHSPTHRQHGHGHGHRSSSGRHHRSATQTYVVQSPPAYQPRQQQQTYVYTAAPGNVAYTQQPTYAYAQPTVQHRQPAAYVVDPRKGTTQVVYHQAPQQTYAYQQVLAQPQLQRVSQQPKNGFFSRMFSNNSKNSGNGSRVRAVSVSRW